MFSRYLALLALMMTVMGCRTEADREWDEHYVHARVALSQDMAAYRSDPQASHDTLAPETKWLVDHNKPGTYNFDERFDKIWDLDMCRIAELHIQPKDADVNSCIQNGKLADSGSAK